MQLTFYWDVNDESCRKTLSLTNEPLVIGRSRECELAVLERTVSRRHAEIFLSDGQPTLRNINTSNNLTRVDGLALEEGQQAPLQPDSVIELGKITLYLQRIRPEAVLSKTESDYLPTLQNDDDLVGRQLGKYQLLELVGEGGMAKVYRAYQTSIEREVAVKVLHPHLTESHDFLRRFKREAQSLGRLQHPHVLRVLDFDTVDGVYFMAMEFISGGSLGDVLESREWLSVPETVQVTRQLLSALDYAHQQKIVHRDLKPDNIMLTDECCDHVILADFSLARLLGEDMTQVGTKIGTPTYMSPEAGMGYPADERADFYSLGITMYQMLTGTVPFKGKGAFDVIAQQINQKPIPPSALMLDLPAELEQIILKAIAKRPEDRFQNVAEFRVALDTFAPLTSEYAAHVAPAKQAKPAKRGFFLMIWAWFMAMVSGLWRGVTAPFRWVANGLGWLWRRLFNRWLVMSGASLVVTLIAMMTTAILLMI